MDFFNPEPRVNAIITEIKDPMEQNKELEVEHQNLILGQKLIDLYEERIKTLTDENNTLRAQLSTVPNPVPVNIRPTFRTLNQIKQALEKRSFNSYVGKIDDNNNPKIN